MVNAETNKWTYKKKLFPYLCEYRKGFNTQYALLPLIERWEKILESKGFVRAVLIEVWYFRSGTTNCKT